MKNALAVLLAMSLVSLPSIASAQRCPRISVEGTLKNHAFTDLFRPAGVRIFENAVPQDSVYLYVTNMPAFADVVNRIPAFACYGLALAPNDVRSVRTVGELIDVIAWGLRHANRR